MRERRESFQRDSKPPGIRAQETNVFHDMETKRGSVEQDDDDDDCEDDEENENDGDDDSSPSFVKPFSCLNGREMETRRKKKARRAVVPSEPMKQPMKGALFSLLPLSLSYSLSLSLFFLPLYRHSLFPRGRPRRRRRRRRRVRPLSSLLSLSFFPSHPPDSRCTC